MFQTLIDPAFLARENGGTPVLDLNFAALKSLDSRITFIRGSSGTYLDSSGIIKTATSNTARFTHNSLTGQSLGLLIEGASTNLYQRSEEFNDAYWTKTRCSISANASTAPDGATTADKLVEDTSTNSHEMNRVVSVTSGQAYTFSIFIKQGERSRISLELPFSFPSSTQAVYDLSTGTVVSTGSGASASITAFANGFYRCIISSTANSTGNGTLYAKLVNNGTNTSYTGDGSSGLYIWGAQAENSSFATSYIQTTSETGARAADVATMTSTNFSAWYNQTEGTIVANAATADSSTATIVTIDDNTLNNRIYIQRETSSSTARGVVSVSGSNVASIAVTGVSTSLVSALSYKANQFNFSAAGTAGTPDTSGTIPTVDRMRIGTTSVAGYEINGTIARLRYFNRALATSVQAIST
jgi:hypothetical protein